MRKPFCLLVLLLAVPLSASLAGAARAEPCCALDYVDQVANPGWGGPRDVAFDAAGSAVYALVSDPNDYTSAWVQTWERDPQTGDVSTAPVDEVEADGGWVFAHVGDSHVYLVSIYGDLIVLDRDPATGSLSNPRDTGTSTGRESFAFAADSSFAYLAHTSVDGLAIRQIRFGPDGLVGEMAPFDPLLGLTGATGIAISPDEHFVYAATHDGGLHAMARDAADGSLTLLDAYSGLDDPNDTLSQFGRIAIHPSGRFLYQVRNASGVLVWQRDTTTGLLARVQFVPFYADQSSRAIFSQSGSRMILGAATGNASFAVWDVDPDTGELSVAEEHAAGIASVGLVRANRGAISPDGSWVYLNQPLGGSVDSEGFHRFRYFEEIVDVESLAPLSGVDLTAAAAADVRTPTGLAESPDGLFLFVALGADDKLSTLSRDPESGAVEEVAQVDAQVDAPGDLVVSPDGSDLYAVGADGLAHFSVADGVLTHRVTTPGGGESLAISPDGARLFSTQRLADQMSVFERGAAGALTPGPVFEEGVDGVASLDAPYRVVVSPDGGFVYVTSSAGFADTSGTAVFRVANGQVLFDHEEQEYGAAASQLAISPDGRHVYHARNYILTATADMLVSERSAADGSLTRVERLQTPFDRLEGLEGNHDTAISGLAMGPDGTALYVINKKLDSIVSLRREGATGRLRFVEARYDGDPGLAGMVDPGAVLATADGAQVYVAAQGGARVLAFARVLGAGNSVRGFMLPKKVKASAVGVAWKGNVDFGPEAIDLSQPIELTLGDLHWNLPGLVPSKSGTSWKYAGGGVSLSLKGPKDGSSLARLSLKAEGDFSKFTRPDAELEVALGAANGRVGLAGQQFALGKAGRLMAPRVALEKFSAKTANPRKARVKLALRLAEPPDGPVDVSVSVGDTYSEAVQADALAEKGNRLEYKSESGPLTALRLDRAKGTLIVDLRGPQLAGAADGDALSIGLALGGESYVVKVRVGGVPGSRKY